MTHERKNTTVAIMKQDFSAKSQNILKIGTITIRKYDEEREYLKKNAFIFLKGILPK